MMARQAAHVLNIGSVNIDHVYQVDHFVRPGETLSSTGYHAFAGGKGFNQSVALARAGVPVRHAGCIGRDGAWLLERLAGEGVDIARIRTIEAPTGHAMIQVSSAGENAIVLHRGANASVTAEDVARALESCCADDILLVQNETSSVAEAIRAAKRRGLQVVFNPAPMSAAVLEYPLRDVDCFVLNETEAEDLTGERTPEAVLAAMRGRYPGAAAVLTMGARGAAYLDSAGIMRHPGRPVQAVDTTGAGDTFIGFFLSEMMRSGSPARALARGCDAAAVCITRPGAADSIPFWSEVASGEV
jgi:ribokinase